MSLKPRYWLLLMLLWVAPGLAAVPAAADKARYEVGPAPEWVDDLTVPAAAAPAAPATPASVDYLLVDRQARLHGGVDYAYMRAVMRLGNADGVNRNSQLTINFDPQREVLRIHTVTLRRGNEVIDELRTGRIEVLQRETTLERALLDGSLTFHLLMSDVRVGDTLDYSFTLERRNPEWGNRFAGVFTTEWSDFVRRSRVRILTDDGAPLFLDDRTGIEPSRQDRAGTQSVEWNWTDLPATPEDSGTPSWYVGHRSIQFSQFATWREVAAAAGPLWALEDQSSPELAALVKRMKSAGNGDAERALAVVRFVQEEIRYTGIELGIGAYQPTAPAEVLKRRFGDCKDKTLLAVVLLRKLGIDAIPALVSTTWQARTRERLPSPGIFNHAIVQARIAGATYWLDVTDAAQGGTLTTFVQSDLGAALLIAPGVSDLSVIPRQQFDSPQLAVSADFDVRKGLDKDADLHVTSVYTGPEADALRRTLRGTTPAELQTQYLNYYRSRYPGVHNVVPLHITDDLQANLLTVVESYEIEHPFETDEKGVQVFECEAEMVNMHLKAPATQVRSMPLALAFPVFVTERISVRLPSVFTVKDETTNIDAPTFRYQSRSTQQGSDVLLEYSYRSLDDYVPLDQMSEFLKKREAARVDTYQHFTSTPGEKASAAQTAETLRSLQSAVRLMQSGEAAKADPLLQEVLASPGFHGLNAVQQHAAVLASATTALALQDFPRSHAQAKRASEMDNAVAMDWMLRVEAALYARDQAGANFALTTLAQRWPGDLAKLDDWAVPAIVRDTPSAGSGRYKLYKALFDAKFTSDGVQPSPWWRDLALLQLERNERPEALASLARVTDPYAVISIRADNRFAPVRTELQPRLDPLAASAQEIEATRARITAQPDQLLQTVHLTYQLLNALRFEEALEAADAAIARVNGAPGRRAFTDYDKAYVWILNNRGRALLHLGRYDEAVEQFVAAGHLPERGQDNVSQVINLASLYNELGRPAEARAALKGLAPQGASPYGNMQVAIEQLDSAEQLKDPAEATRALGFLRDHQEDALMTYQSGLLIADHQDEGASLLIARLANPDQRIAALLEVQQFGDVPMPERSRELRLRWQKLVARPDVRAAIAKVGNSEPYQLLPAGP